MYFLRLHWVLLFYYITSVAAIIRSKCPVGCDCEAEQNSVECPDGYWNELPHLPEGTEIVKIARGNFGTLKRPDSCNDYSEVTVLKVYLTNIRSIAHNTFSCMPRLQSLVMDGNYIHYLSIESFRPVLYLKTISISANKYQEALATLCTLKRLDTINLSLNAFLLKPGSLTCLGSLKNLSYVDLNNNIISGPTNLVLQPLKNVTGYISLSFCNISSIDSGTFTGFRVQTLDLSGNEIYHITTSTFRNMTNLKKLDLSECSINMASGWLANLKSLEELVLSSSELINLGRNTTYHLPNLKILKLVVIFVEEEFILRLLSLLDCPVLTHLDMTDTEASSSILKSLQNLPLNNLQTLHLVVSEADTSLPGTFDTLTSLEILDMSSSSLIHLTPNSFYGLTNLISLNLAYNDLQSIFSNSFNGLQELKSLDLSMNLIDQISPNAFGGLVKLTLLSLSDNGLNNISSQVFIGLQSLQELDLSYNQLKNLSPTDFEGIPDLQNLDLQHNRLGEIRSHTFCHLTNLKKLHLNDNNIITLGSNAFQALVSLKILNLNDNNLKEFNGELNGLVNSALTELYLRQNRLPEIHKINISTLRTVDLSKNNMILLFYSDYPSSLQYLSVNSNNLRKMEGNLPYLIGLELDLSQNPNLAIFSDFVTNTKILNFSGVLFGNKHLPYCIMNRCFKLPWQNSTDIRVLDISSCQIDALVPHMFSSLCHLNILYATSNYISHIDPSAFWNASMLIELHLDRNLITFVSWRAFTYLPNLKILSLVQNPLVCTCDGLWVFQAATTPHLVYMLNRDMMKCTDRSGLLNAKLLDVNLNISDCEERWLSMLLWPLVSGILAMFALLVLYLLWRFRWHIRYILFLAKAGRGRYMELQDETAYKYDAFVAYASEDLPWVKEQMLPNIDETYIGEKGFKLCIHHRDWLAGIDIVENIVNSIAESRRTILVLSKDFAMSRWCQFELAMAHMRLDAEGHKRDRLLVVLLEDIDDDLLSSRLIYLLTNKTYLTWPQDPNIQHLFWKTLCKSLKKELFYSTRV